ncbi:hypothetical protein ABZT04_43110 [Streptomyces sp. NPDC005492]|uniref:hypothetical protein n=1 Tax=Streptomyces sp. NPDC005492 TaxID=3156883 RepID=UPI0033AB54AF
MTNSHGRKSRARKTSRTRGAAYVAANAGTLHRHGSGPSATDLRPSAPSRWGVASAPDMRIASALIGACIEGCAPCRAALAAKLLDDEDPIALAVTAGAVCNLLAIHEPDGETPTDKSLQTFLLLVMHARLHVGEARVLVATVEAMSREDRAALLEAALELWAHYGPQHMDLVVRGQGGLADLTAVHSPAADPGTEAGTLPVVRTAAPGQDAGPPVPRTGRARPHPVHRPPLTTSRTETPIHMSENTKNLEQYGEDAARALSELVGALQYRGITYPLEAYRIFSYLTRTAGELRTAVELLGTSVQGLHDRDRLMTDYRGEPLDEVIERFTELCGRSMDLAGGLNGTLSKAHSAVGHLAYKETPDEQESEARG